MRIPLIRPGTANGLHVTVAAALAGLLLLGFMLISGPSRSRPQGSGDDSNRALFLYCAAGMRYPMERIAADYEREYGIMVELQYGGSNTLLSQLQVSRTGDLYLAGDASYIHLAQERGLAVEALPLARMKPVIAVRRGNPKGIASIEDLLSSDVKVGVGNPDAAAVGKKCRKLLTASGHWESLQQHVTDRGIFMPTVNEIANGVKLGSIDAGIIWDATAKQYDELEYIAVPELDVGLANIEISLLASGPNPTASLRFARYVGARDRGLQVFAELGFDVVEGDVWEPEPELTFFAGSVNRQALAPILKEFADREGIQINTVYNGCGILTAQMQTMQQNHESGFPDAYMACDVYYLETVRDWFQDDVNISDTDIVIVVQKGNPKNIRELADLARPGVRVAIGQPEQCTIGVLSRRLLEDAGIYEKMLAENVETQTLTSALLVPNVTTGAVDAVLAYVTDTLAERERLDVIHLKSSLAKAVQPYSIARSSEFKHLGHRLYERIAQSREAFESAGFNWRLELPESAP